MNPDDLSLARYRVQRCERSFARIVESNLGFVISIAERILHNRELARDTAQKVFIRLALHPEKVPASLPVEVWLHRTTRSTAIDMVRSEEARRRHESTAATREIMKEPDADWSRLAPEIDRALDQLPTADRIAIVLRFFKNHSHDQIGSVLGVGGDAARMRVQRALEKLRHILSRRGLSFSAAALAATLPAHASTPVTAELSTVVTSQALAAASATSLTTPTLFSLLLMNAKHIILPATCAALLATALWQRVEIADRSSIDPSTASTKLVRTSASSPQRVSIVNDPSAAVSLVAEARRLAAIEPLAAREAALLAWAEQFTSTDEMLSLAPILRDARDLTSEIRGRIAQALTTQWATVDPAAAMDAYGAANLDEKPGPFGDTRVSESDLHGFDLIARVNPEVFSAWIKENPGTILELLTWKKLGLGLEINEKELGTNGLIRNAPFEFLSVIESIGLKDRQNRLLEAGPLAKSLIAKSDSPGEIWSKLSASLESSVRGNLIHKIARESALADSRPLSDRLVEVQSAEADWTTPYRLAAFGDAISREWERLPEGDAAAEESWWNDFETYGQIINSSATAGDSAYDSTRAKMALLGVSFDKQAAIEWTESITNDSSRRKTAAMLALQAADIDVGKSVVVPDREGITIISRGSTLPGVLKIPWEGSVSDIFSAAEQALEKSQDNRAARVILKMKEPEWSPIDGVSSYRSNNP